MNHDFVIALLRTTLQMAGASLAAKGVVSDEQWVAISGGVLAAASVLWMLWARYNTRVVADPAAKPGVIGGGRLKSHAWLGAMLFAALLLGGCAQMTAAVETSDAALARLSRGSLPAACAIVSVAEGYFDALAPSISAANHTLFAAASSVANRICAVRPADTVGAIVTLADAWADIQAATKAR